MVKPSVTTPGTRIRMVLEHRLVMARYLGRPLFWYETVHHIDGVNSNNSLDNLQLRIGKHGKGEAYECLSCGSSNIAPVPLKEIEQKGSVV